MSSTGHSYDRPIGDITTVLDLASRDAQDGYFFPLNSTNSYFHRSPFITHPLTMSTQEFTHKGTANWGGYMTFTIGSMNAGDLLQSVVLQIKLGHWYDPETISKLRSGQWQFDTSESPTPAWTYVNNLGSIIVDKAEFIVGDQTIEQIDGQFIKAYSAILPTENMLFGISTAGLGTGTQSEIANNTGPFSPNRPWPTDGGVLFCILPFFFQRIRFKEMFPILSVPDGAVRISIKLRDFDQCVRSTTGQRSSCIQTPLGQSFTFFETSDPSIKHTKIAKSFPPDFIDFRIVTYTGLVSGSVRKAYIEKPFEQKIRLVQSFFINEPFKYVVNKKNAINDTVDLSIPLELNHPCQELLWIFRRKSTCINNDWGNFSPQTETMLVSGRFYPEWLIQATLMANGMIIETADDGQWWRQNIAGSHRGGWNSFASFIYGYSFAKMPDSYEPSGSANMSRMNSIRLNCTVRVPFPAMNLTQTTIDGFDDDILQGWEMAIYSIHINWLRFENGLCSRIFSS